MSQSVLNNEKTFVAGADLSAKQYYFVKQDTDGEVILASAGTDVIIGVLQNKPLAGEAALVRMFGTSKLRVNGTPGVGAYLTAGTSGDAGKGVATTTAGDVVRAVHLGDAAAADEDIVEVMLTMFHHKA